MRSHYLLLLFALGRLYGQVPTIADGGILNAASSARGQAVAPGSLVSIYGTDLAPGTTAASTIPLPTTLNGVSVTINNIAAPLLLVSAGQINAQVPVNVPPGTASVVVTRGSASSPARTVQVIASAPGIFTTNFGVGQAIAIHADGALVAPSGSIPGLAARPANAGDTIVILGTGLGTVEPSIASGAAAGSVLRNTVARPAVLIGGREANVDFSGLSPEFVGVNQLNVVVPAGVGGGDRVTIQVRSGTFTSTDQATIAVGGTTGPRSLREVSSLPILGSSPRSIALNGSFAYVCGSENITVVDISDPSNPRNVGRVADEIFNNVGNLACYVDSNRLIATADAGSTLVTGTSPSVAVFQLSDPARPTLVRATAINKNFMGFGFVRGNSVFVPTNAISFSGSTFLDQRGDVLSIDISDPNNQRVASTLFTGTPGFNAVNGGSNNVFFIAPAGGNTALASSSTSTGANTATGAGRILVIDTSNPAEVRLVRDVTIPGTRQARESVVDNDLAVVIGAVEGWRNPINFPAGALVGPTAVTTLNTADPQRPSVIRTVTTTVRPDLRGSGAAIIGTRQYVFGGTRAGDQPVFLLVDARDANNPVTTTVSAPVTVNDVRFANGFVFAALEGSGLGIYRVE